MTLSEAQQDIVALIEDSIGDEIDAIGTPDLDEKDRITVQFQYGETTYDAVIDPEAGTMTY